MSDTPQKPRFRVNDSGNMMMVHDGLQNVVSGLGTRMDKRSANRFVFSGGYFDFVQLEAAYSDNWIARQIVDVPVEDALREWREWQCAEASEIRREEKRLNVQGKYMEARKWARLYGGASLVMIADQPLDEPFDINKVRRGSLKRLVVLDRWELSPQVVNFTDPVAENYLLPEWYTVRGGSGRVHSSHVVRVDGEDLPRRLRALNEGWGDSRLRQVMEDLQDVTSTKSGIAALVQEANVDVVQREGLSNELATDQESAIMKRFALGSQMKSLVNMLLLDGTETYERKSLSFSGLEGVLDKLMVWISGAADIPMTRLFGRSAAGMDATGEGDMNNYYDSLASRQENKYRHELEVLDQVMVRSTLGEWPEDCEWSWNPLYQESGTELAQQELAYAQSEDMRIAQGVLKPSQVALRLKNQGRYAIEDADIERMQADEDAEANGEFDPEPEDLGQGSEGFKEFRPKGGLGRVSPYSGRRKRMKRAFDGSDEFSESKVKRDPDGKFSETGGGNSSSREEKVGSSETKGDIIGNPSEYKTGTKNWVTAHRNNRTIPDGWYVHGRSGGISLETGNVIQLTQSWEVAEQYARGDGGVFMISSGSGNTMSMKPGSDDLDKVAHRYLEDYESGEMSPAAEIDLPDDLSEEEKINAIKSVFSPDSIVDSAQAWDNTDVVRWFIDNFDDVSMVETPDGGVVIDVSSVESVLTDDPLEEVDD